MTCPVTWLQTAFSVPIASNSTPPPVTIMKLSKAPYTSAPVAPKIGSKTSTSHITDFFSQQIPYAHETSLRNSLPDGPSNIPSNLAVYSVPYYSLDK